MQQRDKLSVAIIGAGIGGLAVSAALRRIGVETVIYEQAEKFTRLGAGIQQSPNAMLVHRVLGIEERLRDVAFSPATSLNRDAISGTVTNEYPLSEAALARYGAPYLTLHRGDLHAALADIVPTDSIRFGKKLRAIENRDNGVALSFVDGTDAVADLVIGADGVHSLVRDYVSGPEQPRFTGRVAYRTTFPASRLSDVDIGLSRTKWWGKDRHIVIYYVTAARDEVYFVTSQPERADWITRESWSAKGDVDELRAAFSSFHRDVGAVLAAAPEVHKWGIFERDPLATWSRGRIALLGDACHPMTPYMASGATMALEDAAVLSRCFAELDNFGADFSHLFGVYEATRKPRTSLVQAGSSANQWMRNATNPDWLYGHDPWSTPLATTVAA